MYDDGLQPQNPGMRQAVIIPSSILDPDRGIDLC